MAEINESLEELKVVKQSFKDNFESEDISTNNVEFRNMPELIKGMEKKLPHQTKSVNPTTSEQVVTADMGYKLTQVNVNAVRPSDYYKPETSLDITPSETEQTFSPTNNQVYNTVKVGAISSDYIGSAVERLDAQIYIPTTTDIVVEGGQYLNGSLTIKGDANLLEENIAEGKEIFGITGTHKGGATSGSPKFAELVDGSITEVNVQDLSGITTIRDSVFANLEIISVEIPSNIIVIDDSAFVNNEISSLVLNNGVTTIGASAFANNPITELSIPNSVTTIGASAFAGTQITELDMSNQPNPPNVTSTSLPDTLTTIHVAYGDYGTYISAWSDYADKIVRGLAIPSTITVTVNNYLGELVTGASVTIEGNGQTFTGTTDANGVFVQGDLQPATYTITVPDVDGFKTPSASEVVVEENTQNVVTLTYLEKPAFTEVDAIFANNSPKIISQVSEEISANNMTSAEVESTYGWKIGDTISYQLTTGENVEMRIIGFNHDDKSDGSGKAGITLDMTHCLNTAYVMNSEYTTPEATNGYLSTVMNITTLPSIKATIPQEWQNVIKMVDKVFTYPEDFVHSQDLFLLSGYEVFGRVNNTYGGVDGDWYEYYELHNTDDSRCKGTSSNPSSFKLWKLRSCYSYMYWEYVGNSGGYSRNIDNKSSISFAFCI